MQSLLQALAARIAAGQKAGKTGLSEAMDAYERQRQMTIQARVESEGFQEALTVAQV